MAVSFDALGPGSSGAGGAGPPASPLTWSHTCTGSQLALFVGVVMGVITSDADVTIDSVTYHGVGMTLVPGSKIHSNSSTLGFVSLYYLANPDTGSNTVSVSFTNGTPQAGDVVLAGSMSFTGVDQGTIFQNLATATGSAGSPSVNVTSASGNMVLDVVCNGAAITNANQTQRWLQNVNAFSAAGNGAQETAAGASSVTMSYTSTADWWAIVGLDVVGTSASVGGSASSGLSIAVAGTPSVVLGW